MNIPVLTKKDLRQWLMGHLQLNSTDTPWDISKESAEKISKQADEIIAFMERYHLLHTEMK